MSEVWVLIEEIPYAGDFIRGIYRTEENAKTERTERLKADKWACFTIAPWKIDE